MIALWTLHVTAFLCNWALVSPSTLTSLKDDGSSGLRIFKEPNEALYPMKRHAVNDRKEDTESKDRRSPSGFSSFIRFGRGVKFSIDDGNAASENGETDSKVSRRGTASKPPDIIIRFGRSSFKATHGELLDKRGRNDLNFIRFGRGNVQIEPADLDLSTVCAALASNDVFAKIAELHPDVSWLLRLCGSLYKITGEIGMEALED